MNILYSISRQQQLRKLTDVYFSPPLHRVGLLQRSRFDQIVTQGHDHAIFRTARSSVIADFIRESDPHDLAWIENIERVE